MKPETILYGAGALALLALGVYVAKKGVAGAAAGAAGAVVDAAAGATAEVVQRIGEAVGIPRTDETACQAALREGRTWDASFACSAGDFVGGVWRNLTTSEGRPNPANPDGTLGSSSGGSSDFSFPL